MNAGFRRAINAYGKQDLATQVEAASPHRLILMLFDGAIKSCHLAKLHMQNGAVADKGMAITKAIAIIQEGLSLSLDKEVGGDLVANLEALYDYMGRRLLQANLHNDPAMLDEVLALLAGLKESWEAIDPSKVAAQQEAPQPERVVPLSYGRA